MNKIVAIMLGLFSSIALAIPPIPEYTLHRRDFLEGKSAIENMSDLEVIKGGYLANCVRGSFKKEVTWEEFVSIEDAPAWVKTNHISASILDHKVDSQLDIVNAFKHYPDKINLNGLRLFFKDVAKSIRPYEIPFPMSNEEFEKRSGIKPMDPARSYSYFNQNKYLPNSRFPTIAPDKFVALNTGVLYEYGERKEYYKTLRVSPSGKLILGVFLLKTETKNKQLYLSPELEAQYIDNSYFCDLHSKVF